MTTDTRHENLHAMKTLRFLLPLLLFPAMFAACSGGNSPVQRETAAIDTVFTQARIRSYGRYYKGLELKVVSLDLYSEGLRPQPDSTHNSGTSLRFSDIFIDTTDTRLPEAMYVIDSVPALHSALPALYFDGQLTGACLLQVIDAANQHLQRRQLQPAIRGRHGRHGLPPCLCSLTHLPRRISRSAGLRLKNRLYTWHRR